MTIDRVLLEDGFLVVLEDGSGDILLESSTAGGVTGTLATTNANDTLAGAGYLTATGTLARTNANDVLAGIGTGPTAPQASGGRGGGGSTQNSRSADFTLSGKRRFEDEPKRRVIDVAAKQAADAVVAKAQEIAREKAALKALKDAQQREKTSKARLAKAAAMEARVAEMEANLAILQDDEEVLQLFLQVLKH